VKDTNHLTLEQKVGQLFVLGFQGYELDRDTRTLLEVIRPGGFLLFQRNIESFDQIYGLTTDLRNLSAAPAILAIDHEGGRVDRLKHIFSAIPSMPELAAAGMAELRLGARIIAAELQTTGFNLDFAPVVDLRLPDSLLAERCLAASPAEVVRFSSAFIEELSKRGIVPCAKHFPGLGGAITDPHFSLPRVDRNKRQIQQEDTVPFVNLFDQAGLIMVSHAHYPGLGDEKPVPASLSTRVVETFLRKRLGYKGLTVTDDLTMGAVTTLGLTPELFLRAFEAGNDLLLFSQTTPLVEQGFRTIVKAARRSEAVRRRLDASVDRILALKSRMEFVPLRYRTHLKGRITRQIDKLRKSLEPVQAVATRTVSL
jgi:beta-N-acetylhexosaminidase